MTTDELLGNQCDLESLLQSVGPADFIQTLKAKAKGAELRAHETRWFAGGRGSTRFVFVDRQGQEALLEVNREVLTTGKIGYSLHCERLASA